MAGATVREGKTIQASGFDNPPHNFMFKTKAGKTGLLQVTGFTENPPRVKIRYKLVQTPRSEGESLEINPPTSPSNKKQ